MKRKFSGFLCLLLSGIIFSGTMASCQDTNTKPNNGEPSGEPSFSDGQTDIGKILKTDKVIVENGKTEYKILIPENADSEIVTASNELKMFLSESTGASFTTTTNYTEGDKYFSLGNTQLIQEEGLSCTYQELGFSGYKIKTVDDSVCIYAYDIERSL